ncbi:hypothetical protein HQ584_07330 [Patescibacteria group bacterium]|nr:hypothetical protein [Patescibacteria group bacterium]
MRNNMRYILVIGIPCIAFFVVLSLIGEAQKCQWLNANIGNTVIIAITAILVLFYVVDTHSIAKITERELQERIRPRIGFELYPKKTPNDIITHVFVKNNSTFFCEVYTDFNMQVYDTPVEHSDRYTGREVWYILPGHTTKGQFYISEILQKAGKNLSQVIKDTNYDEARRLFIDVHIKAEGRPGGIVEYPKLHWYFDFSKNAWVYMS